MSSRDDLYCEKQFISNGSGEDVLSDWSPAELFDAFSHFANGLTRVKPEQLFNYTLSQMKSIIKAKVALINTFDRQSGELVCRSITVSDKDNSKLTRIIGSQLIGFRSPVSSESFDDMVTRQVARFKSLNEATFGKIPLHISSVAGKILGIDSYIILALVLDRRLIGTLLLAGEASVMIQDEHLLKPFAAVIANTIELKEKEEEAEAGREWYRTIAEDIPAMVCRVSPDHKIIIANDAYCTFYGEAMETIKNISLSKFLTTAAFNKVVKHLNSLTPENPIAKHEHPNINKDGVERWVRWINRAIFDDHGAIKEYLSIGEDITESKQMLSMLQESEAVKSTIIEATPDLIILHDEQGHYLDILSGKDELLYRPRQEMIGKKMEDILPGKIVPVILESINKALETGIMQTLEFTFPAKEGPVYLESRIKVIGDRKVITFVRDITERKNVENALRQSEEKYREIIDNIQEAYYEVDLEGNLVFFNNATVKMLGYSAEELKGMSFRKIYKDPETVYQTFRQLYHSGSALRSLTLELIHKDGSLMFSEISASLIRDKLGNICGFRGLARDITERVRLEDKLKFLSMHDQLTGLHNRAYFEEEMKRLEKGRDYPVTMISADLDDLKLVNDSLGHLAGDDLLRAAAGILKISIRKGDILARVGGDEFTAILPTTDEETGELVAARIRSNIEAYNREHPELPLGLSIGVATANGNDKKLHEVFKQADDHMYHDKLYRSNRVRNRTVEALMTALAERDYITEGHAQRLADLCRQIGEKIGLTSRQLSDLALLAHVHDLGKVGIPDSILFKKGLLNSEEWQVMRLHPEKGYRIAITSPDLSPVADLILKHHERWDGQGYPLGLSGEEIPVECRILAVVDAFDAMTSDRPYSKARKVEEALSEILKCSGTQFDPNLVDIFISLF